VATRYGPGRARAAALLLLGLRGCAFMFQGQELGLPDAEIPAEAVVDIDGRDPVRAPIPWEPPSQAGPGAGFTTGTPWLPVVRDAERLAASVQRDDPRSDLAFWTRLIALRREHPALGPAGGQRMLDSGDAVLAWVREAGDERLLIAINMSAERVLCDLAELGEAPAHVLLSTDPARQADDARALGLAPDEGVVVRLP
jgi:alpha-glucosidase